VRVSYTGGAVYKLYMQYI